MADAPLERSFDSREDYELYMRLMQERQRIQRQAADERRGPRRPSRQKQRVPVAATKLEERERGFHLYVSGANEERVAEARRRSRQRPQSIGAVGNREASRPKEWQVETVELRGQDGRTFKLSPSGAPLPSSSPSPAASPAPAAAATAVRRSYSETYSNDDFEAPTDVEEMLGGSRVSSRPGSASSTGGGLDSDTRGVLRLMNDGDPNQLSLLRESLTKQLARRSGATPVPLQPRKSSLRLERNSRPSSGDGCGGYGASRPSSSSSSQARAIASAVQAENARVLGMTEAATAAGADSQLQQQSAVAAAASGASSRPSSKSGRLLPVSAEAAAGAAPPSLLGSSGSAVAAGLGVPAAAPAPADSSCSGQCLVPPPMPTSAGGATGGDRPESGGNSAEAIASRVNRLNSRKQKALLRMLDNLELEASSGGCGSAAGATLAALATRGQEASTAAKATASSSDRASVAAARAARIAVDNGRWTTLRLRLLSSWGDGRLCGLGQLEALGPGGEVLRIPPAALTVRGAHSGTAALGRVVDGRHREADRPVWVATACAKSDGKAGFEPLDLIVTWPSNGVALPVALQLWSLTEVAAAARGAEVFLDEERVWAGELPKPIVGQDGSPIVIALVRSAGASAGASASVSCEGSARGDASQAGSVAAFAAAAAAAAGDGGEDEDVMRRSLRALETFRTSQSRRFFAGSTVSMNGPLEPLSESLGTASATATAAATDVAAGLGRTATFGLAEEDPLKNLALSDELNIEGLRIPVVDFDGLENSPAGDCDDDDDDHGAGGATAKFGASIIGATFDGMRSITIPTLPRGRRLVFNCVSTWGDQDFVGLAGIELFDGKGCPVVLKDVHQQVSADPPSINVLPEYEHDPRTADKLFDQVNLTRDDFHVWLAPFTSGRSHTISVDLGRTMELSMVRVWNYNKSRLHSSRGVKDFEIILDDRPIFAGELGRAPGTLARPEQACEHILFTQEESLLAAIEEHDWLPEHIGDVGDSDDADGSDFDDDDVSGGGAEAALTSAGAGAGPGGLRGRALSRERPATATQGGDSPRRERSSSRSRLRSGSRSPRGGDGGARACGADGRPMTRARDRPGLRPVSCASMTLVLHSTWGDPNYVGLSALEVLDASMVPLPAEVLTLAASPADLNDLEGVDGDPRVLANLTDGLGCTTDASRMWLAPFLRPGDGEADARRNILRIEFRGADGSAGATREVVGLNLWNYNKSAEDTCRGVREFSLFCDGEYVATYLCRKAPGHVHFDFKQVIRLDQRPGADAAARHSGAMAPTASVPSLPPRAACNWAGAGASGSTPRPASRERSLSRGLEGGGARKRTPSATSAAKLGGEAGCVPLLQQYEPPLHPCGFVFKLLLLSTWSDPHYVGLDGLELLDREGGVLRPAAVFSNRGSVRDCPGMEQDRRSEENLRRGAPGSSGRMWLAPFATQPCNSVELAFDEPVSISCLRVWNYSRTPARGVRDVEVYVDDILVYQGILRQAGVGAASAPSAVTTSSVGYPRPRAASPARAPVAAAVAAGTAAPVAAAAAGRSGSSHEAILFTASADLIEKERAHVYLPSVDQLVSFFDQSGLVEQPRRTRSGVPTGLAEPPRPPTALLP
eukprot:TRINITY_DN28938_c1_g1_i1.p1 TRINITY_DN28938_c1_g1~~TRINITY_DN28938_c1_g1_i1.p1  ORF type:complete len:1607 (-),score=369.21 TRINITY_DN28938_c1_g1_i1:28-4848(-)